MQPELQRMNNHRAWIYAHDLTGGTSYSIQGVIQQTDLLCEELKLCLLHTVPTLHLKIANTILQTDRWYHVVQSIRTQIRLLPLC